MPEPGTTEAEPGSLTFENCTFSPPAVTITPVPYGPLADCVLDPPELAARKAAARRNRKTKTTALARVQRWSGILGRMTSKERQRALRPLFGLKAK